MGPDAPKYAWVMYVDNHTLFDGALVLCQSLVTSGTRHDMIIMHPADVAFAVPKALAAARVTLRVVERLDRGGAKHLVKRYAATINKVYIWTLTSYDRVCWLDADMIVTKNIDDVFHTDFSGGMAMAAAPGCTCNIFRRPGVPTSPHGCPFNCPGPEHPYYANTGLMMIEPSLETFEFLRSEVDYDMPYPDQDAFNIVFKGRIVQLPPRYNFMNQLPIAHPNMLSYDDIAVYHFCYGKPWDAANLNPLGVNPAMYELWRRTLAAIRGGASAASRAATPAPRKAPSALLSKVAKEEEADDLCGVSDQLEETGAVTKLQVTSCA